MKKILFTGGGSGGHVTLNVNLIPLFQKQNWDIVYIGSQNGIEKDIIGHIEGVKYYPIATGKLRRYFSWENFKDALRVPLGIFQAWRIIHREKPDIVFSKGGFVSFPVVFAAYLNGCRNIFMHESDVTPGLANKMAFPFVSAFFTTFPETEKYVKNPHKVKYVGPVLSDRLKNGDKEKARIMCGFTNNKPVLMFVGGSLGAKSLNAAVRGNLKDMLAKYNIVHICGKGQTADIVKQGYAQFEFVDKEFKDLLALTDVVISRSGSNAIFEFLSLYKPMLLVPLPSTSSRGEQSLNAESFKKHGFAEIIRDADINQPSVLLNAVHNLYENKETYVKNMQQAALKQTSNSALFAEIIDDGSAI